jgi:hypothetical protein
MNEIAATAFVRHDLVPERPAPVKTTGFVGFLRTRLFNSSTNILITIASALLLWFTIVPSARIERPVLLKMPDIPSAPAGRSSRQNSASSFMASIPNRSGGGSI